MIGLENRVWGDRVTPDLRSSTGLPVLDNVNRGELRFSEILNEHISKSSKESRERRVGGIDRRLMEVCYQMESLFINQMLKSMRRSIIRAKLLHGGIAEDIFTDFLFEEYSNLMAKSADFGLASTLYRELRG